MTLNIANNSLLQESLVGRIGPGEIIEATAAALGLPEVKAGELNAEQARQEPVSADTMKESFLALETDAKKRGEKWARRLKEAEERNSWRDWWYIIYLLALQGCASRYTVKGSSGANCSLERRQASDWMELGFNVNLLRSYHEVLSARLNFQGAVLKAYPRTNSAEDVASANAASNFARILTDSEAWKAVTGEASQFLVALGTGITITDFDFYAESTRKLPDGRTETGPFGAPVVEVVPPYAFFASPGIDTLDKASWCGSVSLRSFEWAMARYPEKAVRLKRNAGHMEDTRRMLQGDLSEEAVAHGDFSSGCATQALWMARGTGSTKALDGEPLVVATCFEKFIKDRKCYVQRSVFIEGQEMESGVFAAKRLDEISGEYLLKLDPAGSVISEGFPYEVGRYYWVPGQFMGQGIIGDLLEAHAVVERAWAMIVKDMADSSATFLISQLNNKVAPFKNGPKPFNCIEFQREKPTFHKIQNAFNELIFAVGQLEALLSRIVNLPDAKRGESPGSGISGKAIDSLIAETDGGFGNIRLRAASLISRTISRYIRMFRDYSDDTRVFLGVGQGDAPGTLSISGADLKGWLDTRISLESELPRDPFSRAQLAQVLMGLGIIDNPEDAADLVLPNGSLEKIDWRSPQDNIAAQAIGDILGLTDEDAEAKHDQVLTGMRDAIAEAKIKHAAAAEALVMGRAPEPPGPLPEEAAILMRNDLLNSMGLGVLPYHSPTRQARETLTFLCSDRSKAVSAGKLGLIAERWATLAQMVAQAAGGGLPPADPPVAPAAAAPSPEEPGGGGGDLPELRNSSGGSPQFGVLSEGGEEAPAVEDLA